MDESYHVIAEKPKNQPRIAKSRKVQTDETDEFATRIPPLTEDVIVQAELRLSDTPRATQTNVIELDDTIMQVHICLFLSWKYVVY